MLLETRAVCILGEVTGWVVTKGMILRCRLKELGGARPHNQRDAELAAGMGAPDNGQKAKPVEMES